MIFADRMILLFSELVFPLATVGLKAKQYPDEVEFYLSFLRDEIVGMACTASAFHSPASSPGFEGRLPISSTAIPNATRPAASTEWHAAVSRGRQQHLGKPTRRSTPVKNAFLGSVLI